MHSNYSILGRKDYRLEATLDGACQCKMMMLALLVRRGYQCILVKEDTILVLFLLAKREERAEARRSYICLERDIS